MDFKLGGSELGHYREMGDIVDVLNASENQQSRPKVQQYLERAKHCEHMAFSAVNVELKDGGGTPLYCVPEKVVLTGEQLIDILRRWVESKHPRHPRIEAAPVPTALLYALRDAFPCAN